MMSPTTPTHHLFRDMLFMIYGVRQQGAIAADLGVSTGTLHKLTKGTTPFTPRMAMLLALRSTRSQRETKQFEDLVKTISVDNFTPRNALGTGLHRITVRDHENRSYLEAFLQLHYKISGTGTALPEEDHLFLKNFTPVERKAPVDNPALTMAFRSMVDEMAAYLEISKELISTKMGYARTVVSNLCSGHRAIHPQHVMALFLLAADSDVALTNSSYMLALIRRLNESQVTARALISSGKSRIRIVTNRMNYVQAVLAIQSRFGLIPHLSDVDMAWAMHAEDEVRGKPWPEIKVDVKDDDKGEDSGISIRSGNSDATYVKV